MKTKNPINQPHKHFEATYGKKTQYAENPNNIPKLKKDEITELMQILGSLLFYARAIDSIMLIALSDLS